MLTCQENTHTDLPLGVAEDDGLCDGQSVVQIAQRVKLPLLSLHGDEELLYSLQSQLVTAERRLVLGRGASSGFSARFPLSSLNGSSAFVWG